MLIPSGGTNAEATRRIPIPTTSQAGEEMMPILAATAVVISLGIAVLWLTPPHERIPASVLAVALNWPFEFLVLVSVLVVILSIRTGGSDEVQDLGFFDRLRSRISSDFTVARAIATQRNS